MLYASSPIPHSVATQTTLNNQYKVDQLIPEDIDTTIVPKLLYYGIGNSGYRMDGDLKKPFKPKVTDLDLYNPIPFRILGPNQSLSVYEQELYRLPIIKLFDGVPCTCYMLKCLRVFKNSIDVNQITAAGLEISYEVTSELLTPIPDPEYQNINLSGLSDHVLASVDLNYLTILPQELKDIAKYYYADDITKVDISEWGLYSGYEHIATNKAHNIQLAFKYCNTGTSFTTAEEGYSRNIRLSYGNKLLA